MRTFKDATGREWIVEVNIATAKRVKALLDFNLVAGDFAETLQTLLTDPVRLCDVIYVIVKPQADALRITDEDFGKAMAGDAIEAATEVLLAELADFIPNRRDRERARKALEAFRTLFEKARDVQEEALSREIEKALPTSGPRSGDSPGE